MMFTDDGDGASFLHFTMPDMRALRRPDFDGSDLTQMERMLVLSEPQMVTVRGLLEQYRTDFAAMQKDILPTPREGGKRVMMPGGIEGEGLEELISGLRDGEGGELGSGLRGGGRVMIHDPDASARSSFEKLHWFPPAQSWVATARFEPAVPVGRWGDPHPAARSAFLFFSLRSPSGTIGA